MIKKILMHIMKPYYDRYVHKEVGTNHYLFTQYAAWFLTSAISFMVLSVFGLYRMLELLGYTGSWGVVIVILVSLSVGYIFIKPYTYILLIFDEIRTNEHNERIENDKRKQSEWDNRTNIDSSLS